MGVMRGLFTCSNKCFDHIRGGSAHSLAFAVQHGISCDVRGEGGKRGGLGGEGVRRAGRGEMKGRG